MKLLADFHTHTKNSRFFHGKNSIEEMTMAANELGLKEVGITDHGFKHLFCTNKEKLMNARKVIDEINTWSKTKVLLGVEANIISEDGTIDVDNETLALIDILLVGYHRLIKTDFAGIWGGQSGVDAVQRATNAFLNAIEKYPITIIVHPNSVVKTDLYQIGCACRDKGVMIELSNRHMKLSEKDIEDLIASGCMYVVSSDAHSREEVGSVDKAFEVIRKYNIPSELVANVEFEEHERSEEDKEIDLYYGIYKQKKEEKERRQKELEEQRRIEFSNSLSNEMEEALLKIAKDKGLEYMGKVQKKEDDDQIEDYFDAYEDEALIRQANEYLSKFDNDDFDKQNENLDLSEIESLISNENNFNEDISQNNLEEVSNNFKEQLNNLEEPSILKEPELQETSIEETAVSEMASEPNTEEENKPQSSLNEEKEAIESKPKPKTFNKNQFGGIASILEAGKESRNNPKDN